MRQMTFPIRSDKYTMTVAVKETLAEVQSPFQHIEVVDTYEFGKMLFLDGHVQLATRDEHAYHECFVHVPLASVPNAKSALVVGGGDGGVLRELVRHAGLETIHMVEIDQVVIDTSKKHLPDLNAGAFDDPRVSVFVEDAFAFVQRAEHSYDLILLDATDTYEEESGELSEQLFTDRFYADCAKILNPGGVAVTQADNPVFCPYSSQPLLDSFRSAFGCSGSYWALVPSFGGFSAYVWGGAKASLPASHPEFPADVRYLDDLTYNLAFRPVPF